MKEITLDEPDDRALFAPLEQYTNDLKKQMGLGDQWHYQPTGWLRNDFHDKLIDIIGDDNIRFVSSTTRRFKDGHMYTRTSLFVNDKGIDRVRSYHEANQEGTAK